MERAMFGSPLPRFLKASVLVLALSTPGIVLPSDLVAQAGPTGTITGRVADAQGASIAGAQIEVVGINRGSLSGADGAYSIRAIPAGTQTLEVTSLGYATESATVEVPADGSVAQDFTLSVDPLGLESLVVTATRTPITRLESSTALTTVSDAEIEQAQPRSTADLLKAVPGFYVEASGGEVNNNLFVRGLPADGSYRYVVMLEDGMMAFDGNDLFFLGADNLVRVDENVERIEAVRGGNSALFGSNAPGGLVNVINKTGGPDLAGSFKAELGTDGYTRYGGNVNGPLAEDWRFSLGGFYRYDDGIRDPGFPSSRGGQLKANITRHFDRGFVRLYGTYINDKNAFYLNLPVSARETGESRTLPTADGSGETSFDVTELTSEFAPGIESDATLTTNDANFARIPLPQGNGEFTMPLEHGIAQVGGTFKGELGFSFPGGWEIENILRAMSLKHENNAMPPGVAKPADEVAEDLIGRDLAPGETADFTFLDDGSDFNTPNGLVQEALLWHVERPISNFSNQFLVKKTAEAGAMIHNFTLGSYFGFYSADHLWMFNNLLTNVENAPRLLNLTVRDAGGSPVEVVTENGFSQYLDLYTNAQADATLFSFFAGDEMQVNDRLRVDIGARFERDEYSATQENTSPFDLGGPSNADDAVNWGNRTFARRQAEFNEWAASIGVNYLISDHASVYGRGGRGYKMPLLDQYAVGTFPDTAETLWQGEAGVKISTPTYGLSALAYIVRLENFPSQDVRVVDGMTVFETAIVGEAQTLGFEFEGVVMPYPGFRFNSQVTLQDPQYESFIDGGLDLEGNRVRRIPQILFNLGGSYTNSGFRVGADYRFTGKRFSNTLNTVELPEFGIVNGRVSYMIADQGITVSAGVVNALDGQGLTEGDPRFDEAGAPTGFGNARPILPRRFTFGVRYDF
jgi:outer membrane receptor protein involved in Fe transport